MALLKKKIRVVVIDDSVFMRTMISDILSSDPQIEVVGSAADGKLGVEKVKECKPDVVTCDVEMPSLDGIGFLKRIMVEQPVPVVMVSSITEEGGAKTLEALEAGAFDFIQKPKAQYAGAMKTVSEDLLEKVREASNAMVLPRLKVRNQGVTASTDSDLSNSSSGQKEKLKELSSNAIPQKLRGKESFGNYVIAIGISTGGPPMVTEILKSLVETSPPVFVVQHMPENFTKALADRIAAQSKIKVVEAKNGMTAESGTAYIAPGNKQMRVTKEMGRLRITVDNSDLVSGHRPSVDALFESLTKIKGLPIVGVLMTGMGRDGATQLKKIKEMGNHTICQDQATCVVYGMPKAAIEEGAADEVLPLAGIISRLKWISEKGALTSMLRKKSA